MSSTPATASSTPTTTLSPERIGMIGLGNMGVPMARNLAKFLSENSLPPLTLWNRHSSKMIPASESVLHAKTLEELVHNCEIIITSLSSDSAVEEVYGKLFEAVKSKQSGSEGKRGKRTLFVETSTIYPRLAGELERQATAIPHVYYLQCPIFGPPDVAANAELLWVVSGDVFAKRQVTPFLVPSMGRKFIDVGSNVERAAAFKLNGNFCILGILETLAEALTLADKTGVGADLMMEFITDIIPSETFSTYGQKMTKNDFAGNTGFTVSGGLRDANHLRHLAASVETTCPVIDLAHRNLMTTKAVGGADMDWSSLCAGPRLAAGLSAFTGVKEAPRDTGFGSRTDDHDDKILVPVPDGGIKEVQNFKS